MFFNVDTRVVVVSVSWLQPHTMTDKKMGVGVKGIGGQNLKVAGVLWKTKEKGKVLLAFADSYEIVQNKECS